jgi:hypothetical protein
VKAIDRRKHNRITDCCRLLLIKLVICFLSINIYAQNGPFIRFSLGPGFMKEYNTINELGFTIITKNHAIGWGFSDKYAVSFSEFSAFIKKDIRHENKNFIISGIGNYSY